MTPPVTPLCPPRPTAEFSIWTREAGAGGLSISVEGPSKAEIAFEDRKDGSCGVSYVVQEPGMGGGWGGGYGGGWGGHGGGYGGGTRGGPQT